MIRQTWGTNYMDFLYDESGSPYSFIYNGTQYYYVKNLQGDVVKILNASGSVVANYYYDAWGKVTTSSSIGQTNPIRYRGYYYDTDTGFYYLQSRYYDPAIKRFINADGYVNANGDLLGFNMYAYCGNNPINYCDPTGEFGIITTIIIASLAGAALSAGFEALKQAHNGRDWNFDLSTWNWWEIGKAALIGAANGFAYGVGGVAGGIVKGSFQALTLVGKALTVSQSVGLLLGTATLANFAAGFAGYAMHTAGSETEDFNFLQGVSKGIGQTGKGALSFFTGGMYGGFGSWKVGIGAKNSISSSLARGIGKFVGNYIPNYIFENLF